ncbi:TIGR03745 family integrating conjugative element membrane protein [Stutzerimonas stutzeri]
MLSIFKKIGGYLAYALVAASISSPALAALPRPDAPSRGEGSGFLQTLQNYAYDIGALAALAVAAVAFIIIAINAIQKFHEVTAKKATWTDFFTLVLIGGALLLVVLWLVNEAIGIL